MARLASPPHIDWSEVIGTPEWYGRRCEFYLWLAERVHEAASTLNAVSQSGDDVALVAEIRKGADTLARYAANGRESADR